MVQLTSFCYRMAQMELSLNQDLQKFQLKPQANIKLLRVGRRMVVPANMPHL